MPKENERQLILLTSKFIKQKEYWLNKLSGEIRETRVWLPGDKAGSSDVEIRFPGSLSRRLIKLSKQSDLSVYIILLVGLKVLISRYAHEYDGSEDITVISPLFKERVNADTFNTHLYIRDSVSPGSTFKELILQIRQTLLDAYENQDYPMDRLEEFLFDSGSVEKPETPCISHVECILTNIHDYPADADKRDKLVFLFTRQGEEMLGRIRVAPSGYAEYYLRQLARHYINLLAFALNSDGIPDENTWNIDTPIGLIPILSEEEMHQSLYEFTNASEPIYPDTGSIVQWFDKQVEQEADAIALVYECQHLTYKELKQKANRLSKIIKEI